MKYIERILNIDLPSGQSAFLWGPRKTGKSTYLRPLTAFIEEYSPCKAMVVCNEREERVHGQIRIMPYQNFLRDLWTGKIIR
jgi:predicted AAA+ superfamily ATPase